jgi:predicted metal-dependent hydrolase
MLAVHGYRMERFVRLFDGSFRFIERLLPPSARLAATAACEHLTASMADEVLAHDRLRDADPAMRELLQWHVAEEIEHKAVAYDVLQRVAPSYWLRVLGLFIAVTMLGIFWTVGTLMLIRQDRLSWRELRAANADLPRLRPFEPRNFLRALRDYVRPSFHPWDNDNLALCRRYLEGVGRWEA